MTNKNFTRHSLLLMVTALLFAGIATFAQNQAKLLDIDVLAGRKIYALKKCGDCHNEGAAKFTPIKAKMDSATISEHSVKLELPIVIREEKTERKKRKALAEESAALAVYLKSRKEADAAAANMVTAGFAMVRETCRNCHLINGLGKDTGPDLKGVGAKHDKKWLIDHFVNPQAFVKDSLMPKFDNLPKEELEAMADYLLAHK